MIDRNVHLKDYHLINDRIFERLKNVKWRTISLKVYFWGVFVSFVWNNLVRNCEGQSFRNYWDDNLKGSKFVGSKVPKVSQMKADINCGLDGVLVEVKLKFLHFRWKLMIYKWAKIKNCFLILHLSYCIIVHSDNFTFA